MPTGTFGMGMGLNPNLSRQSRRLYIGSITPEVNEINLADFFNDKMKEMNIGTGGGGNPVLTVQCNYEKNYAFIEVRDYSQVCNKKGKVKSISSSVAPRMQLPRWLLMA
jgi:splicing factor U2AF 65 kDa subunit